MLACEPGELEGVRRGAREVTTHHLEYGRKRSAVRKRADVGEVGHPLMHAINERNCAIDVAERPGRHRQIDHRGDARVLSEAKGQIVVAAGLEQVERLLEVIPRLRRDPPASQHVIPTTRWATPASGELGLAPTSLRKAAACARTAGKSPRMRLPSHKP